jgi:hypothetical protein
MAHWARTAQSNQKNRVDFAVLSPADKSRTETCCWSFDAGCEWSWPHARTTPHGHTSGANPHSRAGDSAKAKEIWITGKKNASVDFFFLFFF